MIASPVPSSDVARKSHHAVSHRRLATPQLPPGLLAPHHVTSPSQHYAHGSPAHYSWTADKHNTGAHGPAYMNGPDRGRGVSGSCYRVNETVVEDGAVKRAQPDHSPAAKGTSYRQHLPSPYGSSYIHSQSVPSTNSYPNLASVGPLYNSLFIPPTIYPPGIYPRATVFPGIDPYAPVIQPMGSQPLPRSPYLASSRSAVSPSVGYCPPDRQSSGKLPLSVGYPSSQLGHSLHKTEKSSLKHRFLPKSTLPHSPADKGETGGNSVGEPSPKRAHFSETVDVSYDRQGRASEVTKCRTQVTFTHTSPSTVTSEVKRSCKSGDMPAMPSVVGRVQRHYPAHFMRGSIIQLATGDLKRVEELTTDDFVSSAKISPEVKIDRSILVKIEESLASDTALLSFSVGINKVQVTVEAALEHPFYVFDQGWSSCCPERTASRYNLNCSRLQVGQVCISLTQRDSDDANDDKDPILNRKRRWSAPEPCPSEDEEEVESKPKKEED